jgi:hypothetical protein
MDQITHDRRSDAILESAGSSEVYRMIEKSFQKGVEIKESEESGGTVELDKHVHVAVRSGFVSGNGAEDGQRPDPSLDEILTMIGEDLDDVGASGSGLLDRRHGVAFGKVIAHGHCTA